MHAIAIKSHIAILSHETNVDFMRFYFRKILMNVSLLHESKPMAVFNRITRNLMNVIMHGSGVFRGGPCASPPPLTGPP